MQTILHSLDYRSLHPVFNDLERFYALTSEKTLHGQSALITPTFDNAFETLQSLFNQYGDNEYNFTFQTIEYKKLENTIFNVIFVDNFATRKLENALIFETR